MKPITHYTALCLQTNVHVVDETNPDPGHVEQQIRKNLARQGELIDWSFLDPYVRPKLIVLSEFCMVGVPESRLVEDYLSRSVELPGWVSDALGAKAQQHDCYVAANVFERDPAFPGIVFNTSFLVGPDGKLALKYRKNNDAQGGRPKNTNPGDIYDDYVRVNGGPGSLFPVVETPIGRLALMTGFDIRLPELVRCLALRGAEVVIHPTAEGHACRGVWTLSKQVRAWDNHVYLLSCNNGLVLGSRHPEDGRCGGSRIVDFEGRVIAETESTGESFVQAVIDLDALRAARARANWNVLATSRFWMYAPHFEDPAKQTWPLSSFSVRRPYQTMGQMQEIGATVLEQLYERGTFVRPEVQFASNGKPYLQRYQVVCLQTDVHALDHEITPQLVEQNTRAALERNLRLIDYVCNEPRHGPKLVCFSEFHLTGVPESRKLKDYEALAVEVPGWVTAEYGRMAKEYDVYIVGGVFERDPEWPGRVFNTAFLIGPDGGVLLRYRKNNDYQIGVAATTNSGDLYDAYKARHGGDDAFFPVADTELGRIGIMGDSDIRFAEVPRLLALNGAEIVVHPTADPDGGGIQMANWQLAKRIRAWDNSVYFVSVNNGDTLGSSRPRNRQRAHATQIVDFEGQVLAMAENPGETVISATIDLGALRRFRANVNRVPLAISRFATYVPIYRHVEGWPKNVFLDRPLESNAQAIAIAHQALERLYEQGVLVRPK